MSKLSKVKVSNQNIDKFFKNYLREQFTAKDYRLLKGVFCEDDLKNEELEVIELDQTDQNHNDAIQDGLRTPVLSKSESVNFDSQTPNTIHKHSKEQVDEDL